MSNPEGDLIGSLLTLFVICAAVVLVFTASVFIIPAVIIGGLCLWAYKAWDQSPTRHESLARTKTLMMYEEVLARHQHFDVTWQVPEPFVPIAEALLDLAVGRGSVEPPPAICNSIDGARYRDRLSKLGTASEEKIAAVQAEIEDGFAALTLPNLPGDTYVPYRYLCPDLPKAVSDVIFAFANREYFHDLTKSLDQNILEAGKSPIYPEDYKGDDIVEVYLKRTPLLAIFDAMVPFGIPKDRYNQHGLITAGTGAGKSQLVQWFIAQEYGRLCAGDCSIIVMDSQTELIEALLDVDLPKERVCYLNPSDIEYPVPISLFDLGMARKSEYSAADQERVVNKAIEVLTFVIDSVLGAEMTAKQGTLFNYLIRLLIQIPDSTLHTMREILLPGGHLKYQEHIDQLSDTAKIFFAEQYDNKTQYAQTREQITRRLFDVLEVGVFDRMFSQPNSKFDLFEEMQTGKLILLDTEKALLQDSGTELLGRLYLAMLSSAIQERALIKDRKPVYLFCDEARDYVRTNSDTTISGMLEQARKMNVGTFWVTQHLGQIDMKMRSSFMANTAIKMISNSSHEDAVRFSKETNSSVEFIKSQPELTFATFIKGVTQTAVPLQIPYGSLSKLPQRENREELRDYLRATYSVTTAKPKSDGDERPESDPDGHPPLDPDQGGDRDDGDFRPSDTL